MKTFYSPSPPPPPSTPSSPSSPTLPQLLRYDLGTGVTAFSTTRHGGCGTGTYGTFNINRFCGDSPQAIATNRQALCHLLGSSDDRLIMPHQTHQTKVVHIDEAFMALTASERQSALEGVDALTTRLSGVCIGVSTADCIPVLLYDAEHHATCAIHAGWRGTLLRIVQKAVRAMVDSYGTQPAALRAQIGPGISLDSFEVGDEVYDAFCQQGFDMAPISRRYPSAHSGEKWHIDLPTCNRLQLTDAGLHPEHIVCAPVCTYRQCDDFFSARRLGINSGRVFTGIVLTRARKSADFL